MKNKRFRIYFSLFVLLAALALIAREHFNGGVVSHHLLHRADMPAISNWWSILVLPVLTWFLVGRTQKRIAAESHRIFSSAKLPASVVLGFLAALIYGIALSVSFSTGYVTITGYIFQGMFLLAVLFPIYRAECLLGFVLGMTVTFGAVIPIIVGSIIAALSALVHLGLRPALGRLVAWFKR